jgi:glycosyltransferase involved in cell wall biosynthesis
MDPRLKADRRVVLLDHFFVGDEYSEALAQTDVMILPYRLHSYRLRGSRVALEAMVNGIPLIAPRESSIAEQMNEYGAGVLFEDGNVASLVEAIVSMHRDFGAVRRQAEARRAAARAEFSIERFRSIVFPGTLPARASGPQP